MEKRISKKISFMAWNYYLNNDFKNITKIKWKSRI